MALQNVVVNTPPSNYNFKDSENTLSDSVKMQNNEDADYEYQKKLNMELLVVQVEEDQIIHRSFSGKNGKFWPKTYPRRSEGHKNAAKPRKNRIKLCFDAC